MLDRSIYEMEKPIMKQKYPKVEVQLLPLLSLPFLVPGKTSLDYQYVR
jgi:hypothetical protein